jgi:transcription antitermination factor NusA-like protein
LWRALPKVKTALCNFCLKSGVLCPKCSAKLKSGEISELDLKIARLLLSLEEKYPSLQNVFFHKAVEVDKTLAVIVGPGDVPRLLGYGGKIIKALSEETGKSIRVLEYGADDRKFLEDLFAPLSIVTINTIWLPDGTTETRIILKKRHGRQLPFNIKALKEIASKVRNITLRVEFTD